MNNWPTQAAELGIISGLLTGKDLWEIGDQYDISSASFVSGNYRKIFQELAKRKENGDPFDYLSIASVFADAPGELSCALAEALINEGMSAIPAVFEGYCETVKNHHIRAHNQRVLASVQEAITTGQDPSTIAADFKAHSSSARTKKKSRLSFRTITELMHMEFDDSDNYFGDRVIAASQPLTILGPGGIGKSRLLTQLAFCMITGRTFLDIETHASGKKWLIFQTENSNRRIKADIAKMIRAMNFQKEDVLLINDCFRVHTIEKDEDTFLDLENPSELAEIQAAIDEFNPDFVAFDPLNTFTSLELNNDKDMKAVVTLLSRVVKHGNPQRVPVVIHHSLTGKIGAAKAVGWDKGSYGRNSKSLYAWTRAQINLAPQDPDNPNLLIMACGKNNNGAHFQEIGVMLDDNSGVYRINPDFDPEEFRQNVGLEKKGPANKKACLSCEDVADLFEDKITRTELLEKIKNLTGCGKSVAYETLSKAEKSRAIIRGRLNKYNPIYTKPEPENPKSEF